MEKKIAPNVNNFQFVNYSHIYYNWQQKEEVEIPSKSILVDWIWKSELFGRGKPLKRAKNEMETREK